MTTATKIAPHWRRREIIGTEDRGPERSVRYRTWIEGYTTNEGKVVEPSTTEDVAVEVVAPVSREVLEDRWAGLLQDGSKLQYRLYRILTDIAEHLTRRDQSAEMVVDGELIGQDFVMDIDGLEHVIRDWMLERAAKVAAR